MKMTPEEEIEHERAIRSEVHPAAVPFLWLGRTRVKENFIWFPLAGLIICSILGVIFPQKHPAPWEVFGEFVVPGTWAIFGFLAYSFIVFSAPVLFKLLSRPEDYYGEGGLPDPEYSTDPHYIEAGGDRRVGKNAEDLDSGDGEPVDKVIEGETS